MTAGARRPVPDLAQVRALVLATVRRATRKPMMAGRRPRGTGLLFVLLLYFLLGLLLGIAALTGPEVFTFLLLTGAFTLVTAGLAMVAEASTLLFDPTETDVLGHRPIHPRTLLLARGLGLFTLAMLLALALNLVPMFGGLAARGARPLFPLAHLAGVTLLVAFTSAVVVFLYALLSRVVSRRVFDTVASWTQVGMTVLLIVAYQIVPRTVDRLGSLTLAEAPAAVLALPPAWFAAVTLVLMGADTSARALALAGLGVAATALLVWAAGRFLAAGFARQAVALGEAVAARPRAPAGARDAGGIAARPPLALWLRDPVERGAFALALAYLTRDRDLRMRLYPSLGAALVLPVIVVLDREVGFSAGAIVIAFLAGTLPATVTQTLRSSTHHAAADLFRHAPLGGTPALFHGVRKAALLVTLPVVALAGAILWFGLDGHRSLLAALPALLVLPAVSLLDGTGGGYLPLAQPPSAGSQVATAAIAFLAGGATPAAFAALAIAADGAGHFWPVALAEAAVALVVHRLLLRLVRARHARVFAAA